MYKTHAKIKRCGRQQHYKQNIQKIISGFISDRQLWVVQREEVELTEEVLGRGNWASLCG